MGPLGVRGAAGTGTAKRRATLRSMVASQTATAEKEGA